MKKENWLKALSLLLLALALLFVVTYSGHTSELIDPSMTGSSQNETGSSPNSVTPLDDLKDSWAKLKEELKGLSEDSETLSLLLDKALTEASALQSSLTQSMTQSETLKRLSMDLETKLRDQDQAHRAQVLALEIERGWWVTGTVISSILAVGIGVAWILK